MVSNRRFERFVVNGKCHDGCSLSSAKLGVGEAALVLRDIEDGNSDVAVAQKHAERDATTAVSHGSVNRHRKNHLDPMDAAGMDELLGEMSELEALDLAIKQGQKNMHNWKMTPSEWMKAMELKLRIVGNSELEGMNAAIAAASAEVDDEDEGTTPAAVRPGGLEAAGSASESLLSPLPEGPAPPRTDRVAG